jgi:hypothetical protein
MKRDPDERNAENLQHMDFPQPGDYWHEMFCPYLVVLKVLPEGLVICDQKESVDAGHWTWSLGKARLISRSELAEAVRYRNYDGFVADVCPRQHMQTVLEWVEAGEQYELPGEPPRPPAVDASHLPGLRLALEHADTHSISVSQIRQLIAQAEQTPAEEN